MNEVEFGSERQAMMKQMQSFQQGTSSSKFANWLINKGIVQTEAGAQKVQITLVILNIIITLYVVKTFIL